MPRTTVPDASRSGGVAEAVVKEDPQSVCPARGKLRMLVARAPAEVATCC